LVLDVEVKDYDIESMSRTIAIVEARMASSRLPGKVMLPIGDGLVIDLLVSRLRQCKLIDEICVATTVNEQDEDFVNHLKKSAIRVHRGSDWNVLDRVLNAAEECQADVVIEITGDCPFVDPKLVDYMIELLRNNDLEYIANNFTTSFADGFDVQVYYFDTLKRMSELELSELEKEHVTMKIRQNPKLFRTLNLVAPFELKRPNFSITLDTREDYEVIQRVYEAMERRFGSDYGILEITNFLDKNPEIVAINSDIHRKGYA
jgi:spore coat polysaccharide biosynthesis protein SpsF